MRKPNLFLIGHPKSGTTALYEFFKQHPDVFVPEMKETNFFSKEFVEERFDNESLIDYFAPTQDKYLALYKDAANEKYLLDATPHYLFSKKAAKLIHNFNPEAKIIAIFRRPVDFLRSLHSELLFGFLEDEEDFEKAVLSDLRSVRKKMHSFCQYSKWVKYKEQLERYTELFEKNNVKVLMYKKFKEDNKKVFNEIAEFLDISKDIKLSFKEYNKNKVLRFSFIKRFGELPFIWSNVKKILPKPLFSLLKGVYIRLIQKDVVREKLPQESLSKLKKLFYGEVYSFDRFLDKEGLKDSDYSLINLWEYEEFKATK